MRFVAATLLMVAMACRADSELRLAFPPDQLSGTTELGAIEVEGVGPVLLTAQKNGGQLVVHAQDPSGKVIGRAESVVGLSDTPIYVMTSGGLKKITIYWGSE